MLKLFSFLQIGASASIGGTYLGFSSSLVISGSYDVNFREMEAAFDGEKYTTTRGSSEQNGKNEFDRAFCFGGIRSCDHPIRTDLFL